MEDVDISDKVWNDEREEIVRDEARLEVCKTVGYSSP